MSARRWRAWPLLLAIVVCPGAARAGDGLEGAPTLGVAFGARPSVAADATGQTPAAGLGPLGIRMVSSGLAIADRPGRTAARLGLAGRVELPLPAGLAWAGAGVERRSLEERASSTALLEAGAFSRLPSILIAARAAHLTLVVPQAPLLVTSWTSPPYFQSPPDTIPTVPYWQTREARPVGITSLESAVTWTRARWEVEAWTGLALGSGLAPIRLARLQTTRWIGRGVGLTLGLQSAGPRWLGEGFLERPAAELGVRLQPLERRESPGAASETSPVESRWSLVKLGFGRYALRVRVNEARAVALRGDFTRWEPLALARAGGGWWEATVEMVPGLHLVELSVDGGAWRPPPGAPTTPGAYGNEIGTIVAR